MRLRIAVLLVFPIFVVAAIWLAASGDCGPGGGCIATARVEGQQYTVSIVRDVSVAAVDIKAYALATSTNSGHATIDQQTYRLGTVDPHKALVMMLVPGQVDDAGPIGNYLLLLSDVASWQLACPYFHTADGGRPPDCP